MPPQRLPVVNADDGTWGDIIRQFLMKEHYNDDTNNAVNGGHQKITIRPGTASAGTAPLKFTTGTLLTTPEAGAVEFNGDNLYFTQATGPTRKKLAAYDDASGANGDIYYRNSSGYFTRLAAGSAGDFLTIASGIPSWTANIVSKAIGNTNTVTVLDTNFTLQDDADNSKQLQFQLSGIATGTTRTLTAPNASGTIYVTSGTDVSVADGGTGRSTNTTAYGIIAAGTTATNAMQTIAPGTSGHFLKSAGTSALASFAAITAADITGTTAQFNTALTDGDFATLAGSEALTNKTINSASNTITNLDVGDFAGAAVVTAAEGIASNNVDTAFPTSAAVKSYVDGSSSSAWAQVLKTNLQNTVPVYVSLTGWNFSNSSGQQIHISAHIASGTAGARVYLEHKQGTVGAVTAFGIGVNGLVSGGLSELAWWADSGTSTIHLRMTMSATSNDWRNTLVEVANGPAIASSTSTTEPAGAAWTALPSSVVLVSRDASETLANKTLTAPRIVNSGFIADANGNELIVGGTTASAVNEIRVSNAATGNGPTIAAQGGDSNVDLNINTKGSGHVNVNSELDMTNHKIVNVTWPTLDSDSATKGYVDYTSTPIADNGVLFRSAGTSLNTVSPESWQFTHMPHMFNDIAYNNIRGGSVIVRRNGATIASINEANLFTPDAAHSAIEVINAADTFQIEVTLCRGFDWTAQLGIVQHPGYRARDIIMERYNSVAALWTTVESSTDQLTGIFRTLTTGWGGSNPVTKVRFTLSDFTIPVGDFLRITNVFALSYDSPLLSSSFMPLGGGTMYGQISNATDPTAADHLARKGYVDTQSTTKVDKTATANRVYVTDGSGVSTSVAYTSTAATASTMVYRGTGGVTAVGTPTADVHAATKLYVDTGLAAKANTTHTHTASQVSDSTTVGRAVLTAADAAAARTAIGAGTGSGDVTTTGTQTLTNKTLDTTTQLTIFDANLTLQDDADATKIVKFSLDTLATARTVNLRVPNVSSGNHTLMTLNSSGVVQGKSMSGVDNTFTDIPVSALGTGKVTGSNNGTATSLTLWKGTNAQYVALGTYDANTVYVVTA